MLEKIIAGKNVVFIGPASNIVDKFEMPDDRMICPHFERLKLAANGCFYQCDWCYLKLTYRATYPPIIVRAQYEKIKEQNHKRLSQTTDRIIFNSGELADSLSMEHLTGAAREFIPWIGNTEKGHLFMLTKSDNVEGILDLTHNNRTKIAWSMSEESVSRKFEVGAPAFSRRLDAARRVQEAGYPLRIRLDPILPFEGWQKNMRRRSSRSLQLLPRNGSRLVPLRFEENFYRRPNSIFTTGPELPAMMESMVPIFPPKRFENSKRPKSGKYSFSEKDRIDIFSWSIDEIRKYPNGKNALIALCKESARVWKKTGLPLSRCNCASQLDYADMENEISE